VDTPTSLSKIEAARASLQEAIKAATSAAAPAAKDGGGELAEMA
jgi:hypothetical protein